MRAGSVSAEKKALRRQLRDRAGALTEDYRRASDAAIRRLILDFDAWRSAKAVFVYVSMRAEPEGRTRAKRTLLR